MSPVSCATERRRSIITSVTSTWLFAVIFFLPACENEASAFVHFAATSSRSGSTAFRKEQICRSHESRPEQRNNAFATHVGSTRKVKERNAPKRLSSMAVEDTSRTSKVSDFQDRMRRLVTKGKEDIPGKSTTKRKSNRPSNLISVETLEEYKNIVGSESNRIVVVRFYATWCKACRAMAPLYYRLANLYPDALYVEVPVTEANANLHQGLGVPSLPFGHVYHPHVGLVEELKINRKDFKQFAYAVRSYVTEECELPNGDATDPFKVKSDDAKIMSGS